jgi:arylsulfatase A-like enzyme
VSRWLTATLALAAGMLSGSAQSPGAYNTSNTNPPALRRPSILFILADDLGYGDLGCYGQTKIKTPNLDRLAVEGMRFTDFYSGSTVCAPSRAALMLGQHTGHLKIRGNTRGGSLQAGELTISEVLHEGGYRTGLVGKWGLSDVGLPGVPQSKGFDEFVGYLENVHAHDYFTTFLYRYAPANAGNEGFDGRLEFPQNVGGKRGQYIPDLCTTAATNFIRLNKPDAFNQYRPFFLFLSYTIPHANNEVGRRTGNGMEVPSAAPYAAEPWPVVEQNKAAMITRLDNYVGQILEKLDAFKLTNQTLVIFTSDNGPHQEGGVKPDFFQSSGPLRGHKRDLTEGGIRVPFIVRWPGQVPAGSVQRTPFAFWDIFPTLAQVARLSVPATLDGISFLPTLLGQKQEVQHDYLYWEFHEGGFHQAVRRGDWKGIRHGVDGKLELYDLKTDLGEKTDLAATHPKEVAELEIILKTARTDDPQWPALTADKTRPPADSK